MSRIGKLPVNLPAGVSVEMLDGNVLKVKGPKGTMMQKVDPDIKVDIEGGEIKFTRPTDLPRHHILTLFSLCFLPRLPQRFPRLRRERLPSLSSAAVTSSS